MTGSEQTDSRNEYAPAPTPRLARLLEAVCGDEQYRNTRGDTLVVVIIGHWSAMVPLSEVYGAEAKVGRRS